MATALTVADHLPRIGFGDRLRRLRLDLGMDTREFAQAVGIHHATLSRYETGSVPPRTAPHVASSIQLRFGRPDLDLKRWLLDPESTDYATRWEQGRASHRRAGRAAVSRRGLWAVA